MDFYAHGTGAFGEADPLLGESGDDVGEFEHNGHNRRGPRLPCIIRDVEGEVVEAARAKMYIYPQQKQYQTLANRILHSTVYIVLYATMLLLSSLLMGLAVLNWEHLRLGYVTLRQNPGFYMLDALVTLFVVFEVGIRMLGQGKRYWKSVSNLVDFAFAVVAALSMVVFWVAGSLAPRTPVAGGAAGQEQPVVESFEFVNAVFVILRFLYVLLRLVIYSCDRCCRKGSPASPGGPGDSSRGGDGSGGGDSVGGLGTGVGAASCAVDPAAPKYE